MDHDPSKYISSFDEDSNEADAMDNDLSKYFFLFDEDSDKADAPVLNLSSMESFDADPNTNCTSLLNLTDHLKMERDPQVLVREHTVAGFYFCICIIGLLANIALLYAILRGGRRGATFKAPSTILIVNLAVADFLLLLTLPFSAMQRIDGQWNFGNTFCKIEESLKFLSYYGSMFFLAAMAGDRCYSLTRTTRKDKRKARLFLTIVSLFVWLLAILVDIPIMLYSKLSNRGVCTQIFPGTEIIWDYDYSGFLPESTLICLDKSPNNDSQVFIESDVIHNNYTLNGLAKMEELQEEYYKFDDGDDIDYFFCSHHQVESVKIWLISNFVIGFVVPFIVIFCCYVVILLLRKVSTTNTNQSPQSNNRGNGTSDNTNTTSSPESKAFIVLNRRAKKMLDILIPCLILVFIVCWLPFHVVHLIKIDGIALSLHACEWLKDITFILAFSNSALNPILNSLFLFRFKRKFDKPAIWLKKLSNFKGTTYTNANVEATCNENGCKNISETYENCSEKQEALTTVEVV